MIKTIAITALASLLLFACTHPADARMGMHRIQCLGHYDQRTHSDKQGDCFAHNGFEIVCIYDLDECCEGIIYNNADQSPLSTNIIARLLEINAQGQTWTLEDTSETITTWRRTDEAYATHDKADHCFGIVSAAMQDRSRTPVPEHERLRGL